MLNKGEDVAVIGSGFKFAFNFEDGGYNFVTDGRFNQIRSIR